MNLTLKKVHITQRPPLQPAMLRLSGVPEPPLTALPTRQGSWALPCSPRVLKHILPSHTLFQAPELAALLLEFFCHTPHQ